MFRRPFRAGLAAKLAICVVASTAAFFALFGYLNLRDQRRQSEEMVLQEADRISDVIRRSTRYEMLHNDREALYNNINEIGGEPGIRRIRIFNKEGRIRFSTDPREVNTAVDKNAEACYGCHSQQAPLTRLARPDRARIFPDGNGERLLGVIRPIENAPECSNAACHSHPAGQRVLGVIDANLSLAAVDAQLAAHRSHLIWFTLAAMVMGSVFSVAFILFVVYRPVKALIGGTHRVADGDLTYRLPVRTEDELGELAESFNKMTSRVEGAHAEIEEQVRRKTRELELAHKAILRTEKMASIGKLAATVAHEINNPLFGILTYARLILRELDKGEKASREEMSDQLHTIERESRRCGDLVKNLLTFARQAPSHRDAARSEDHRGARRQPGKTQAGHAERGIETGPGSGSPAGALRCGPDPTGGARAHGERGRSHGSGGPPGSLDRARRGDCIDLPKGQRIGHSRRCAPADIRAVFHNQRGPATDWPGTRRGAQHRGATRRGYIGKIRARRRDGVHGQAAGGHAGGGPCRTRGDRRRPEVMGKETT